jgi:hypothetical protein
MYMPMKNKHVKRLLLDPNKREGSAAGVLCYLFRNVLVWKKVSITSWNNRLNMFIERPHNRNNTDKGNINKKLVQDDFTWANFKEAIDFLNPVSAVLVIHLDWGKDKSSEYRVVIDPAVDESDILFVVDKEHENNKPFGERAPLNTLARLYQNIVTNEGLTSEAWEKRVSDYVNNPWAGMAKSKQRANDLTASLQNDLRAPRLTWQKFRIGLMVLNPEVVTYTLQMRWSKKPGDETYHVAVTPNTANIDYLSKVGRENNDANV